MMSSASSITSRLRRPEEVHLQQAELLDRLHRVLRDRAVDLARRPRRSPASASCSGTMSVSGRSAITTAAAWIDELRTIPSRPVRDVDDLLGDRVGVVRALRSSLARLQAVLEATAGGP